MKEQALVALEVLDNQHSGSGSMIALGIEVADRVGRSRWYSTIVLAPVRIAAVVVVQKEEVVALAVAVAAAMVRDPKSGGQAIQAAEALHFASSTSGL